MGILKRKLEIVLTIVCLVMVFAIVNKKATHAEPQAPQQVAQIDQAEFMALVDQAKNGQLPREAISRVELSNHALFENVEKELASLEF